MKTILIFLCTAGALAWGGATMLKHAFSEAQAARQTIEAPQ